MPVLAFDDAPPCPVPDCDGLVVAVEGNVAEEYVFAPRDSEGRARLEAPYEEGERLGARWRETVTCERGHVAETESVHWR